MSSEWPKKPDIPELYRFKLDLALGQGGTGTVYRALDTDSGDIVAVKLFRANFFRNRLHLRDMGKTVSKFKKVSHPNVVNIYEFITGDEGECLILEYIDGPDLKWYAANRPYNLNERLVIVAQIANGLSFIHDNGFIHHDLKPANVLFTRKGQAKLCDYSLFGSSYLSTLFDSGASEQVTPMYVAPEIIKKEKATKVSDLYSFGVMLYLLFTEQVPYEVDNLKELYLSHIHTEPMHPTLANSLCPQELGDIIMSLLQKDPSKRPPDCDQVRIAMSAIGKSRI